VPACATLGVFALAALALLAVPGPSVLYIVTQSIRDGRRAGLVSMLGIQTGAIVHVTAAALGLSALVSSATAFDAVKFASSTC
jgi:threonine/homoserine/homoserine lactone efflux protein